MSIRILPPPGAPRVLAAAQLSNSVGDGAFYASSALYFTRVIGLSPAQIGLGLTLAWAVGSVAGAPLGALADRSGPRGASVLLAVATGAAVGSFLFVRSFALFVAAAVLYAVAQCGLAAARQALLAGLVPPSARTAVLAHLQATLNAGLAVGAAVGGLALRYDTADAYRAVFVVDAVSFLLCAAVLLRLPAAARRRSAPHEPRLAVLRDRPYAVVTLLNAVLLLRMPLLSLAVPLWIVERTEAPGWLASALFLLNTLAVMAFQVRMARGVAGPAAASRAVRRSGFVMAASCLVFALSAAAGLPPWGTVTVLVLGALLHVAGEMRQSAGAWQIGFALAPAAHVGQYQGFFGTGVPLARALGPLLLTWLLVVWGAPGWPVLGALFLGASLAMGPAVRWAERTARARPGAGAGAVTAAGAVAG
ncbi:MFS transporter [Streptomyces alfalfae]|uniref:MFS transporter n=1 Tax=Streptomyces alfalfae TaxID=1642299 RepID=A0ABN4VY99_9ACTN|nr:MFS transporter [Streptomyces alfalfae]AYA20208.1 MFS transporter [Streptomyces fradiae]APY89759.1 MFS transporter [Streptomyces alfalfae]QUI30190.1 MFS transporter [Streptomyces alfalfae]RXX43699.1 MFS transporter [Streptomyces alfalfae]RZM87508.1 MFS transporter [Streptomyces alfalfae]